MITGGTLKPRGREWFWVWLLLAPTLLGLLLGTFGSILATLGISLLEWDLIGAPTWAGLSNYLDLGKDKMFNSALVNTTLFSLLYVPLTVIISFLLALLMNRRIRGQSLFRAIYFLPVISSPTAVGLIWSWIYATDRGLLNNVITTLGGDPVNWLGPKMLLWSVVIVNVWGAIGEGLIIFLAGLQAVPKDYYEAGRLEGASRVQQLMRITVPLMAPSFFFQIVLATIHAFQAFDYIYILTRLGNGNSLFPTMVFSIYRNGFKFFRMGDAAAQAVVLTVIVFLLTLIYNRMQKRWDYSS